MGLFDRIKKGLSKTREKIGAGLSAVLPVGRKVDQALLDDLRDTLLLSDVGPATVDKLVTDVEDTWKKGKIAEAQDVREYLKQADMLRAERVPVR